MKARCRDTRTTLEREKGVRGMPMPIDQDYLLLEQLTTDRLEIHPSPIFRRRSSASLVFSLGTELVDEQTRTSALHHLKPVLPDVSNKEEDSVRAGAVRTESGLSAAAREVGRGHGLSVGAWSGRRMPFDDDGEVEGPCSPPPLFLSFLLVPLFRPHRVSFDAYPPRHRHRQLVLYFIFFFAHILFSSFHFSFSSFLNFVAVSVYYHCFFCFRYPTH